MQKIRVVVIGGGTGSVSVLSGLKVYRKLDLSVIVSMTDDGGSNRVVRDEFGLLPLSDLRKTIIALAENGEETLRNLFSYRFSEGEGIKGHTAGNLMMTALAKITGSEEDAVRVASNLFKVRGKIIPVTKEMSTLCVELESGEIIRTEHFIDTLKPTRGGRIKNLFLDPPVSANPIAIDAIKNADFMIIGPGDLYTSLLSNIVVDQISNTLKNTKAEIIYITNLMTKKAETRGMGAKECTEEIEKYIGRSIDTVFINSEEIEREVLSRYEKIGESKTKDNFQKSSSKKVIRAGLVQNERVKKIEGDTLERSLVRHDPEKLGWELFSHIYKSFRLKK